MGFGSKSFAQNCFGLVSFGFWGFVPKLTGLAIPLVLISIIASDSNYGILNHLFFISVNCQWSSWTWRACSKTCGYGGVKYGSRRKVRHARNGGRRCSGGSSIRRSCYVRKCSGIIMYYYLVENHLLFLPNLRGHIKIILEVHKYYKIRAQYTSETIY